jgi:hypothetical protein
MEQPFAFGDTDFSDAGILEIASAFREIADFIALQVSEHNRIHDGHSMTRCNAGMAMLGMIFSDVGEAMTENARRMAQNIIANMGEMPSYERFRAEFKDFPEIYNEED